MQLSEDTAPHAVDGGIRSGLDQGRRCSSGERVARGHEPRPLQESQGRPVGVASELHSPNTLIEPTSAVLAIPMEG